MSYEYAMSRVRDALEKSNGNHLKAQRLIAGWMEKDQSLLIGLAGPHLQGIIAHALAHADAPPKKSAQAPKRVSVEDAGEFGAALVQSLKGGRAESAGFGQATPSNVSKPGKASKAHVDAINVLVGAGKAKGKGDKGKR